MKSFDKSNIKNVRNEVEAALKQVGKKLGVSISIGRISYDSGYFRAKIEGDIVSSELSGKNGIDLKKAKALKDLEKYGSMFGLSKNDYNKTFDVGGKRFYLVGIKPNRRKYPILGKDIVTGKEYIFTRFAVSKIAKL